MRALGDILKPLWCRLFGHKKPYKFMIGEDGLRYVWCKRCSTLSTVKKKSAHES